MDANNLQSSNVLSLLTPNDFVGRNSELDLLLNHAKGGKPSEALLILAVPSAGLSELLRQAYDRLFIEQGETLPIYFSFSANDFDAGTVVRRFLQTFLLQVVAFRRNDKNLLKVSPDVCELVELAAPTDLQWINKLVSVCKRDSYLKDTRALVRQAFGAPLRANGNGLKIALFFDDFQYVENIKNEINLLDELKEIYSRSMIPFVFAGKRRYVLNAIQSGNSAMQEFQTLVLDNLSDSDAGVLIEKLVAKTNVKITEQTRDLLIQKFRANSSLITSLFSSALESRKNLDDFHQVEKVYVDALLSGRIGKYYDSIFNEITSNLDTQKRIISLAAGEGKKVPLESWRKRLNLAENDFYRTIRLLHIHEIIRLNSNAVEASAENQILRDYLESRYRLETVGEQRALVVGTLLSESLKRAPQMMSRFYRRSSSIGLREIMNVFRCQEIPAGLLDYSVYKDKYKGAEEAEILDEIDQSAGKITLPQVVYTASSQAFYPPISQFSDEERTAVAFGFDSGSYTDESEIVWIAAEIDSKLEASREITEFWCDRLEMIALMCNFLNYRIWLIAPEGFSPEACETLRQRKAHGSSRKQIELLLKYLKAENLIKEKLKANEYEMIVPMGDDTEMIAAHAVEEIARRHHFAPKDITQIKTALVEACINAAEHSLSPDRKIYQKFTVEDDKIVITISNRGVKIPATKVAESVMSIEPDEGRRGWGLKLMRNLMDDVRFEQVDDGTRISMVKYLKK